MLRSGVIGPSLLACSPKSKLTHLAGMPTSFGEMEIEPDCAFGRRAVHMGGTVIVSHDEAIPARGGEEAEDLPDTVNEIFKRK